MTDSLGQFIWYELITPDPDAAKAFYDAVAGWDIEPQPAGPLDYRMIRRSDGGNAGGVLRLSEEMARGGGRPAWLGYLSVDDVDATLAAITAEGGQIHMPATDMPGVGRIAMVTDPAGAPFYVMRPTPREGQADAVSDVFSADRPQHVRWNELATSDPDGATDFYRRHFGWTQEGAMPMGPLGDYRFIQRDEVGIGAIMGLIPPNTRSQWNFYIGVDHIDRAVAALTAGGGQLLHGPQQIPGGEYSANGLDPQGAAFGIVGPRKDMQS
jgi:predicted enzyme related to lactoylglutathione lyase